MTKISVIMPVLLENFAGCSPNRKEKFIRAVNSFLNQTYKNSELIIISDGCRESVKICKTKYNKELWSGRIKLIELPEKNPRELFVGSVRQSGIDRAIGDLITSLDSDDEILPNHLYNIAISFNPERYDWAFFNLYRKLDNLRGVEELLDARPTLDDLCTVNVIFKRGLDVSWIGCDGRQDSKKFNAQLLEKYTRRVKLYGCSYIVHHANFTYVPNK